MVGAIRPSLYATEKVIEPRGDTRAEWQVLPTRSPSAWVSAAPTR